MNVRLWIPLASAVLALVVVAIAVSAWPEFAIRYYLRLLRSDPDAIYDAMKTTEGSIARKALDEFLESKGGSTAVCRDVLVQLLPLFLENDIKPDPARSVESVSLNVNLTPRGDSMSYRLGVPEDGWYSFHHRLNEEKTREVWSPDGKPLLEVCGLACDLSEDAGIAAELVLPEYPEYLCAIVVLGEDAGRGRPGLTVYCRFFLAGQSEVVR